MPNSAAAGELETAARSATEPAPAHASVASAAPAPSPAASAIHAPPAAAASETPLTRTVPPSEVTPVAPVSDTATTLAALPRPPSPPPAATTAADAPPATGVAAAAPVAAALAAVQQPAPTEGAIAAPEPASAAVRRAVDAQSAAPLPLVSQPPLPSVAPVPATPSKAVAATDGRPETPAPPPPLGFAASVESSNPSAGLIVSIAAGEGRRASVSPRTSQTAAGPTAALPPPAQAPPPPAAAPLPPAPSAGDAAAAAAAADVEAVQLSQVAQLAMGVKSLRALIHSPGGLNLGVLVGHLDALTGHVQSLGLALALASSVSRAAMLGATKLVDEVTELRSLLDAARARQRARLPRANVAPPVLPAAAGRAAASPRSSPSASASAAVAASGGRLVLGARRASLPSKLSPRASPPPPSEPPPDIRAAAPAPSPGFHASASSPPPPPLQAQSRPPQAAQRRLAREALLDPETHDSVGPASSDAAAASAAWGHAAAEPRARERARVTASASIPTPTPAPLPPPSPPAVAPPATIDVLPERARPGASATDAPPSSSPSPPAGRRPGGGSPIPRPRLSGLATDPAALRAVLMAAHAQLAQDRVDCETIVAAAAAEARDAEARAAAAELSAAREALAGIISDATRNGVEVSEAEVLLLGDASGDAWRDSDEDDNDVDGSAGDREAWPRGPALVERILRTAAAVRSRAQAAAMHRAVVAPLLPPGSAARAPAATAAQLMSARARVEALKRRESSLQAMIAAAHSHDQASGARWEATMSEFERLRDGAVAVDSRFAEHKAALEAETAHLRAAAADASAAAATRARALLAAHLKQVRAAETARLVAQLGAQSGREHRLETARAHVDGLMATWLCGLVGQAVSEMRVQLVTHGVEAATARQAVQDAQRDISELAAAVLEAQAQLQLQRAAVVVFRRGGQGAALGAAATRSPPALSLRGEQLLAQQSPPPLHHAQLLQRSSEDSGAGDDAYFWGLLVAEWDAAGVSLKQRVAWLESLEQRRRFSRHVVELWRALSVAVGVAERMFAFLRSSGVPVPPPQPSSAPESPPLPWESAEAAERAAAERMTAAQAASVLAEVLNLRSSELVIESEEPEEGVVFGGVRNAWGQVFSPADEQHASQQQQSQSAGYADGAGVADSGHGPARPAVLASSSPRSPASHVARPAPASARRISVHQARKGAPDAASPSKALTPSEAFAASLRSPPRPADGSTPGEKRGAVPVPRPTTPAVAAGKASPSSSPPPAFAAVPQPEHWRPEESMRSQPQQPPSTRQPRAPPASDAAARQGQPVYPRPEAGGEDIADRLAAFVAARQQLRQRAADARSAHEVVPSPRRGLRHRSPPPVLQQQQLLLPSQQQPLRRSRAGSVPLQ